MKKRRGSFRASREQERGDDRRGTHAGPDAFAVWRGPRIVWVDRSGWKTKFSWSCKSFSMAACYSVLMHINRYANSCLSHWKY